MFYFFVCLLLEEVHLGRDFSFFKRKSFLCELSFLGVEMENFMSWTGYQGKWVVLIKRNEMNKNNVKVRGNWTNSFFIDIFQDFFLKFTQKYDKVVVKILSSEQITILQISFNKEEKESFRKLFSNRLFNSLRPSSTFNLYFMSDEFDDGMTFI